MWIVLSQSHSFSPADVRCCGAYLSLHGSVTGGERDGEPRLPAGSGLWLWCGAGLWGCGVAATSSSCRVWPLAPAAAALVCADHGEPPPASRSALSGWFSAITQPLQKPQLLSLHAAVQTAASTALSRMPPGWCQLVLRKFCHFPESGSEIQEMSLPLIFRVWAPRSMKPGHTHLISCPLSAPPPPLPLSLLFCLSPPLLPLRQEWEVYEFPFPSLMGTLLIWSPLCSPRQSFVITLDDLL